MGLRHSLLAAALAVCVPGTARAEPALTLDEAIQRVLAHNPTLAAARHRSGEASAAADAARGAYFPRVSFGEAWQRSDQPVFVFSSLLSARRFGAANFAIDGLNNPDPIGFFHATFAVEQLLFDGGRTRAALRSARLDGDAADAAAVQAASDLVLAATQSFGRLLSAHAGRRAADAAVDAAAEDAARARHRRDVGTATDADVLSLDVHLADMRQRAVQAAGDEAIARAELNRLMGAPLDRTYDGVEPAPSPADSYVPDTLIDEAAKSRAELRRADAAVRVAEESVSAARATWMPTVSAQAGYELSGTAFADRASAWMVGGALRWSISLSGEQSGHLRAAHEALARAQAEREATRAGVAVEIVTAVERIHAARARRDLATTSVEQARESQRIIRDRFEAGLLGVTDVLRAATAVIDADAQRTAATVDLMVAEASLERAVGRTAVSQP